MELHILIDGTRDLGGQLYRQLSEAIRSGRLADGQQLPPSRLLASQLGLSRKTVSDVYDKLGYEKLLVGKVGVGSFVQTPHASPPRQHATGQRPAHRPLGSDAHAPAPRQPGAAGALRLHRRAHDAFALPPG